jgi:hypothetical protein
MPITLAMRPCRRWALAVAALSLCAVGRAAELNLTGSNEVPPVRTPASAAGSITVTGEGVVSGSLQATGVDGTMAHIHVAPAGKNGPPIITLLKRGNTWVVPSGTKLDAAQLKSYQANELYVNIHSEAHQSGEIRAQLVPNDSGY